MVQMDGLVCSKARTASRLLCSADAAAKQQLRDQKPLKFDFWEVQDPVVACCSCSVSAKPALDRIKRAPVTMLPAAATHTLVEGRSLLNNKIASSLPDLKIEW